MRELTFEGVSSAIDILEQVSVLGKFQCDCSKECLELHRKWSETMLAGIEAALKDWQRAEENGEKFKGLSRAGKSELSMDLLSTHLNWKLGKAQMILALAEVYKPLLQKSAARD